MYSQKEGQTTKQSSKCRADPFSLVKWVALALGFVMRVGHPTLGNFVGIVEIFTGNARSLPHTISESHKLKITSKFWWKFKRYQTLNQHIVRLLSLLHISHFQELEIGKSDIMTSGHQGITRVPAAAVKTIWISYLHLLSGLGGSFQNNQEDLSQIEDYPCSESGSVQNASYIPRLALPDISLKSPKLWGISTYEDTTMRGLHEEPLEPLDYMPRGLWARTVRWSISGTSVRFRLIMWLSTFSPE